MDKSEHAYLGRRDGPDFVVVGTHEDIGNSLTGHSQDPLIEIFGLGIGNAALQSRINEAVNALDLILLGKHGDIVLEGIRDPKALVADI